MEKATMKLRDHLIQIAETVNENTTVEDVFKQLSLLYDIEVSENQAANGETLTQQQVEDASKEWLK